MKPKILMPSLLENLEEKPVLVKHLRQKRILPDRMGKEEADQGRFWSRVQKRSDGECWIWTGGKSANGYGQFYLGTPKILAHVYSYLIINGEISQGLEVDHLCRNRDCVNPSHLEAVTKRENILRGTGFAAQNAQKTHCRSGHELAPSNVYIGSKGGRICRICRREGNRRRREVKKYMPANQELERSGL